MAFSRMASISPGVQVHQYATARIETGEKYSMMFAKDAELATQVNSVLDDLKTEGVMAQLHEKWFGVAPDAGSSTVTVLPMPRLN